MPTLATVDTKEAKLETSATVDTPLAVDCREPSVMTYLRGEPLELAPSFLEERRKLLLGSRRETLFSEGFSYIKRTDIDYFACLQAP